MNKQLEKKLLEGKYALYVLSVLRIEHGLSELLTMRILDTVRNNQIKKEVLLISNADLIPDERKYKYNIRLNPCIEWYHLRVSKKSIKKIISFKTFELWLKEDNHK